MPHPVARGCALQGMPAGKGHATEVLRREAVGSHRLCDGMIKAEDVILVGGLKVRSTIACIRNIGAPAASMRASQGGQGVAVAASHAVVVAARADG